MVPISFANPSCASLPSQRLSRISMAPSVSSLRFEYLVGPFCFRSSYGAGTVAGATPRGLGFGSLSRLPRSSYKPSLIVPFAASSEELEHSNIEVEKEKQDIEFKTQESQEAWKETLASFKEQALKMQNISQESYDIYSKKATIVLKETAERLKIQADKARHDFSVIAKEISEEGKTYISTATENSPEHVKEVVNTFTSSIDDVNDISTVRDFSVGIPYGLLLSLGGFLSFMITGSISAIRFGIIPGLALLSLSVSSLKAQKQGESFDVPLKGQAAISGLLFLRSIYFVSQKHSLLNYLSSFISAGVAAFYVYRIMQISKEEHSKGSVPKPKTEN